MRAKAAVERASLDSLTALKHTGKDEVFRIMLESLAW
ncbi:hypothetical protein Pr1d_32340 [Bythopirellula goksoeyrii]|uniref:Uncharacterized protein n=2 Tax=Bythopirellula goksoeyrii TaxID=1400387 RepID=A0A5B9QG75_9BACT|nr:hypothetical protein Pr1d_32340 [Bythopirellula goksoeyrii]